jgi:hypothetical protein
VNVNVANDQRTFRVQARRLFYARTTCLLIALRWMDLNGMSINGTNKSKEGNYPLCFSVTTRFCGLFNGYHAEPEQEGLSHGTAKGARNVSRLCHISSQRRAFPLVPHIRDDILPSSSACCSWRRPGSLSGNRVCPRFPEESCGGVLYCCPAPPCLACLGSCTLPNSFTTRNGNQAKARGRQTSSTFRQCS